MKIFEVDEEESPEVFTEFGEEGHTGLESINLSSTNLSQNEKGQVNMEDELVSSTPSAAYAAKEEPPETDRGFGEEHHTGLEAGNLHSLHPYIFKLVLLHHLEQP